MDSTPETLLAKYSSIAEVVLPQVISWLLNVSAALGILIVGWIAARIVSGIVRNLLDRNPRIDPTIKPFISNVIRYTVSAVVIFAAIAQIGVETASILAVMGAAGLAIGLALQGTLSNVAAGVMLLVLRPMRVDEFIDAEGIMGTVKEVGLFSTMLYSVDGLCVYVPNATLWGSTIKNYSRLGRRRFDIPVGIAYEDDIDTAITHLKTVLADERLLCHRQGRHVKIQLARRWGFLIAPNK